MAEPPISGALVRGRIRVPAAHGLRRLRLVHPLAEPAAPRLALVVAPAGSGKSTLLAHVAEAVDRPVAWLTLDGAMVNAASVLAHLRAAFAAVLPGLQPVWPTADAALADLEEALAAPLLLVIDDLHSVEHEAAHDVVRLFVEYQPEPLRLVLGSRMPPDLDIPRRRLAGSMIEVDADALRFRTWEVDELFRECHHVQLRPREVTALTQRTAGWAAGLQLFHLATHRQPPSTRATLLARGRPGRRLTQDYLARHVLDRVDPELRAFLVRTSVLDELTGRRCDALLETADAAGRLAELERNGLFTFADSDGLVYRYHEVLRGHLLEELTHRLGTDEARALHHRAGGLLEKEGAFVEAIRSYCRAEDWDDVRRVLAIGGASLAREPGTWIDLLPPPIRDQDPWALLALARRLLAEGSFDRAAEMYQRAVDRFESPGGERVAALELRRLQAWNVPEPGAVTEWVHLARAVLIDPKRHMRPEAQPGPVPQELIRGFACLVAGELDQAVDVFTGAGAERELAAPAEAAALLGTALCRTLAVADDGDTAREEAIAAAKLLGAPAVTRVADGLQAIAAADSAMVEYLLGECHRAEDRWGAALLELLAEFAALGRGSPSLDHLESAERRLRELTAPALAAWAGAGAAVAAVQAGRPFAGPRLAAVERAARSTGPLPYAVALLAVAAGHQTGTTAGSNTADFAVQVAGRCGAGRLIQQIAQAMAADAGAGRARARAATASKQTEAPVATANSPPDHRLHVRCLGGFAIDVGGIPVDHTAIRPRHCELLRLLGLHANRVLHREHIIEWLWPGRYPEQGHHSLQVAVSDLRKLLEPDAARGEWTLLRREGSGYRLALASDADSDVRRLERHMRLARAALRHGDEDTAVGYLEAAITTYTGDLLPDDGPAEWVILDRDRLRNELTEACERLAAMRASHHDHAEAVRLARHGLEHDRYRDGLWQRLIGSLRAGGNPAEAAAATRAYEQVLAEIGFAGGAATTIRA